MEETIRVGILDNDLWSATSIARWIDARSSRVQVMWSCTSAATALHHCLFEQNRPHVLILDMALDGIRGIDVCRQIRIRTAEIGVIGITAYNPDRYREELAAAGAQALIAKEYLNRDLGAMIPIVAQGDTPQPEIFMTAVQAYHVLASSATSRSAVPTVMLSAREQQIVRFYANGDTTKEIAQRLGITTNSVFTYMHRVAKKLGTSTRAETMKVCRDYDLI